MQTSNLNPNVLSNIKFENHPELVGTTVLVSGLDNLENDLISTFVRTFPELDSLWIKDKFWLLGTDLVMFWRTRNFQTSIKLFRKREVEFITKDALVELGFLKNNFEMDSHITGNMLGRIQDELEENKNDCFLHILLGFSNDFSIQWNEEWKKEPDYAEQLREFEQYFYLMSQDKTEQFNKTREFSLILSKHFFPRKMFVHDACITNIPSPLIWQYKGGQSPNH